MIVTYIRLIRRICRVGKVKLAHTTRTGRYRYLAGRIARITHDKTMYAIHIRAWCGIANSEISPVKRQVRLADQRIGPCDRGDGVVGRTTQRYTRRDSRPCGYRTRPTGSQDISVCRGRQPRQEARSVAEVDITRRIAAYRQAGIGKDQIIFRLIPQHTRARRIAK